MEERSERGRWYKGLTNKSKKKIIKGKETRWGRPLRTLKSLTRQFYTEWERSTIYN